MTVPLLWLLYIGFKSIPYLYPTLSVSSPYLTHTRHYQFLPKILLHPVGLTSCHPRTSHTHLLLISDDNGGVCGKKTGVKVLKCNK